ncbi:MAG: hypothetical protein NC935_07780 [Candidatus Omnitrophica bacterium]|nr:hypothetical protein [Candidatus Omnitrophota bacterium]
MRKVVLAIFFVNLIFGLAFAAKKPAVQRKTTTVEQSQVTPTLTQAQVAALTEEAKSKLSLNRWLIDLIPQGVAKAKPISDVLTFTDKTVVSEFLSKKGFFGSNYSLRIEPEGVAVFETVQRDVEDNLAAWRGELRGNNLFGTVTIRDNKTGKVELYSFVTVGMTSASLETQTTQNK